MLNRTFVHLPGIGPVKEGRLWRDGIHDWASLAVSAERIFRGDRLREIRETLDRSHAALDARDWHFFYRRLPRPELWRLVPACFGNIAYLDIETTGQFAPPRCHSTTIAVSFRGTLYQEHDDARKRELLEWICREASALGTFFGEVFDIPFLRSEYGLPFEIAHIDMCFWLKRLGYRGGLKKVEKCFPEIPPRQSEDVDGFDAVRLWRWHEQGVPGALETLLTYNAEDTIVLERLLVLAWNLEVRRRKDWGLAELVAPRPPEIPTGVDAAVYARLTGRGNVTGPRSSPPAYARS